MIVSRKFENHIKNKNTFILLSKTFLPRQILNAATRLILDRKAAEPNEVLLRDCAWEHFLKKLWSYYKPTKNPIIQNFKFRQLVQVKNKTFGGAFL